MRRKGQSAKENNERRDRYHGTVTRLLEDIFSELFKEKVTAKYIQRRDGPRGGSWSVNQRSDSADRTVYVTAQYTDRYLYGGLVPFRWRERQSTNTAYLKHLKEGRGDYYGAVWLDETTGAVLDYLIVALAPLRRVVEAMGSNGHVIVRGGRLLGVLDSAIYRLDPVLGHGDVALLRPHALDKMYPNGARIVAASSFTPDLGLLKFV